MEDGIAKLAGTVLQHGRYSALRKLTCIDCGGGVLKLGGEVPTYYQKQVAQALVSAVEGVKTVINSIEVKNGRGR
jgi:osmotically-inducible protein OsmY